MKQGDANQTRRRGVTATLAIAAITGAGAITLTVPTTTAIADPPPAPPTNTAAPPPAGANAAPDVAPGPAGPNAAPPAADPVAGPPGADPNAPPPVADPNAPEPGRVNNAAGGFSYVIPAGWVESDATHLDYGSALLSKETGPPAAPGQAPAVANDTRIVLGRLDQKLYASAEPDNAKAATRLGSDMGEFFMPYPGTRINQDSTPLSANGMSGSASYYEVKFSDTSKPNGQIWTGVISPSASNARQGAQGAQNQRWFVVWLGTANDPVDKAAAKTLAESIRPWTPPPAPAAPPPAAPGAPAPGAPAPAAPAAPAPAAPAAPAPAPNAPPAGPAPAGSPAGASAPGSTLST
jgi:hypothetical protein